MLRAEERGGEASLSPGLRLGRECWEGSGLASRERRREAVQCKVPESHTWEGARGRAGQQPRPRATAQDQRPALCPLSPARSAVPAAAPEAGPSVLGWTLKSTWVSPGCHLYPSLQPGSRERRGGSQQGRTLQKAPRPCFWFLVLRGVGLHVGRGFAEGGCVGV